MSLLFNNFETLADAPGGVKKLREMILQLAVQGKLVPQDPKDEPASVLLEKIQTEKERLIKEGKIKKHPPAGRAGKPLEPIKDSEIPFEVPEGWEWCRLGDITCRIGSGSTPRGGRSVYTNAGIPFLRSQNIWNDGLKLNDVAYIPIHVHQKMSNTLVMQNDVLLNITGGSLGRCAIYPKNIGEANVSQHVTIIRPFYESLCRYLHLCILSPYTQSLVWTRQVGMAREGLSKKVLELFEFPLPPLAEQKRIVAKVDSLMALCDNLEKQQQEKTEKKLLLNRSSLHALSGSATQQDFNKNWNHIEKNFDLLYSTPENIDDLKQTILQLAVMGKLVPQDPKDEPIEELLEKIKQQRLSLRLNKKEKKIILDAFERLEKGIKVTSINRIVITARCICDFITKGTTPAKNELLLTGDIPYLKVYNIVNNIINFVYKPTYISRVIHNTKLKRSKVLAGDVLMNIVGPPLGKVAIVPNDFDEWNINQALAVFRPIESINNKYLYYVISCHSTLKTVLAETKGSAGQDNLSLEQCRNLRIPIYTLNEQKRIVTKVDSLMILCDQLKENLINKGRSSENLLNAVISQL